MALSEDIEGIRDALVHVVAEWTQRDLQVQVAESLDSPLEASEVRALYLVGMNGGSLGIGQLAERGALSRPTTSKLVSRMATQGLFDRVRSGRTVDVHLTETGGEAYERLVSAGQQMVGDAVVGWTPDEIARFKTQLSRFVAGLPHATPPTARRSSPTPVTPQEET